MPLNTHRGIAGSGFTPRKEKIPDEFRCPLESASAFGKYSYLTDKSLCQIRHLSLTTIATLEADDVWTFG